MTIFESFRTAADREKAIQMRTYMRDLFPYLGIPTPERRKLSRDYLKSIGKTAADWGFIFACWGTAGAGVSIPGLRRFR